MRRRSLIALLGGALAWPVAGHAQRPERTYRIAVLAPFPVPENFFGELERNGVVEGHNLIVDRRGEGVPVSRLEAVAAEVIKAPPDAIVTFGPAAVHAAQLATKTIAIVAYGDDPVSTRLVASMSQPGGNTTGVNIFAAQLDAKRLEILHELVPSSQRIGILADPTQEGQEQVEAAGLKLGLKLITQEVRQTEEISRAIDALAAAHVDAINVLAAASFWAEKTLILDRTRALRLPTIYFWRWFTEAGGLISFGPVEDEGQRLLARQLVQVLNGVEPAKLPILQPTKFELIINLKTAKALGIEIPASLLARADEVIQ